MKKLLILSICMSLLLSCQFNNQNLSDKQKGSIVDEIGTRFIQIVEKIGQFKPEDTAEFISEDGIVILNGKPYFTEKVSYNLDDFFEQVGGKQGTSSEWWDITSPRNAVQVIYGKMSNDELEKQYVWTAVWEKVRKDWKIQHLHQSWSLK